MNLSLQSTNAYNPFANLNLSSTQQTQIQSILTGAQSQGESFSQVQGQVQSVLNPTQQQTLQTDLTQLKGHHSGHHHGSHGAGGSSAATDVLSPNYESSSRRVRPERNGEWLDGSGPAEPGTCLASHFAIAASERALTVRNGAVLKRISG